MGAKVLNRSAADGVRPELQALLTAWECEGDFDIRIGGGGAYPPGGLRTDPADQVQAAAAGETNAGTLEDTPHGRGAALDVWPEGFNPAISFDEQPSAWARVQRFGLWAESKGMVWGFRWANRGVFGPYGDAVHVELPNWRALPFPVGKVGAA